MSHSNQVIICFFLLQIMIHYVFKLSFLHKTCFLTHLCELCFSTCFVLLYNSLVYIFYETECKCTPSCRLKCSPSAAQSNLEMGLEQDEYNTLLIGGKHQQQLELEQQ